MYLQAYANSNSNKTHKSRVNKLTSQNTVSGQYMRHAIGWGGGEQAHGTYRRPNEAHLPIWEGLDDGAHEEAGEVDDRVEGAGDDWRARGVDPEVV